MKDMLRGGSFCQGVSVGCGNGQKELNLLKKGIVQQFDLFEISQARVDAGISLAHKYGVADRARFHVQNAFEQDLDEDYDLVYWNNALHHMLDVNAAIRWSHDRLVVGGHFVMDDFVGPSRFQWPDDQLEIATRVREILPARFLVHPQEPTKCISKRLVRPSVEHMIETDPTEAVDSENILISLKQVFPGSNVIFTGGVIYHLALSDVLANFDDTEDAALLQALLLLDETLARNQQSHYAVAIASKR